MKENFEASLKKILAHEGGLAFCKNTSNVFDGLAASQSEFYRVSTAPPPSSEAADGIRHAIDSKSPYRSQIIRLFGRSRPTAISRFVVAVCVDSVKRCSSGSRAHVAIKGDKRTKPFIANLYPAPAPQMKFAVSWIEASSSHADPASVLGALSHPMRFVRFGRLFRGVASARLGVARHELVSGCLGAPPAVAPAEPSFYGFSIGINTRGRYRQDRQPTKFLPDQIHWFSHARPHKLTDCGVTDTTSLWMTAQ